MGEGRESKSCSMKGGQAKGAAAAQTRYGRGDGSVQQWRGDGDLNFTIYYWYSVAFSLVINRTENML